LPSPLAHALAGLTIATIWKPRERVLATTVVVLVAAGLPDVDVFPVLLLGSKVPRALAHHHAVHSVCFAAASTLALALLLPLGRSFRAAWAVLFVAALSHLGLDMCGHDPYRPYGIPVFWPFSQQYWHAPFDLFPGYAVPAGWGKLLSLASLPEYLAELTWTLPPFLLALWLRRRARGAAASHPAAADPAREAQEAC